MDTRMTNGNYHYHSTKAYPYLNGGFYGRVSERGGQVDPQPRAQGIRPALRGLRGATITGFERSKDGKKVSVQYELRGEKRSVSYTTVDFKKYTFTFDNGSRGKSTESYTQRSGGSNGRGNRDQPRGRRAGGDQNSGTPDASPNKRRQCRAIKDLQLNRRRTGLGNLGSLFMPMKST